MTTTISEQGDSVEAVLLLLRPIARSAQAQPICWISGSDDACYDYCSECARRVAKHLRRRGNRDAAADGGWDCARDSDSSSYCHGCGRLLGYSLTEYGLDQELKYWKNNPWTEPFLACHAYEIEALLEAADCCGDYARIHAALEIGRRAAALLDKGEHEDSRAAREALERPKEELSLSSLIEAAKAIRMTPEQEREQRLSFVYGNTHIDNANVTRQMVEDAEKKIESELKGGA